MDAGNQSYLRDYAWKYFSLHAEQRMKTFNFYVVLCTAIGAGILAIVKDATNPVIASPFAFLLTFLSFIFWKLDVRNRQLIKHGENALKFIESRFGPEGDNNDPHVLQLFTHEENTTAKHERFPKEVSLLHAHFSYSDCFNTVFIVFGLSGIAIGFYLI